MNKIRIAQSFSRAASTYDKAAHLQREIGEHLLTLIPVCDVKTIVDLGCGTGFFTQKLTNKFGKTHIIGLDIAKGMLDFANVENNSSISWLCADAESLPLRDNSIDLIFSSLAIQWCDNIEQLLKELKRVLKPGGVAVLSTLGSATLAELKQSWQLVDNQPHVNRFLSIDEIKTRIEKVDFSMVDITQQFKILKYVSPIALMRELKELGAHEVIDKKSIGLMGKKRFYSFLKSYKELKKDELFPATYEVIYITVKK